MLAPFLNTQFRGAMEAIGNGIANIIKSLFGGFNITGFTLQVNTISVGISNVINSMIALSKINLKAFAPGTNFIQSGAIDSLTRMIKNLGVLKPEDASKVSNIIAKIMSSFQKNDFLTALKESLPDFKAIADIVWNDVIGPALSSAWSNIKTSVTGWWNNFIAPALTDLWDNHVKGWLEVLFGTTLPDFWETTLKPIFITMLGNLGIWVDENKNLGENVGLALVNGISGWISDNSAPGSSIVTQIASVLGSLLSIAASVALDTMTGIMIGSVGGKLTKEPKVSPTQLPDTFNKSTENMVGS